MFLLKLSIDQPLKLAWCMHVFSMGYIYTGCIWAFVHTCMNAHCANKAVNLSF